MAGTPFLSRHFLAEAVSSAALIPFPPPGASSAAGGGTTATAHSLLALGGWSEDAGEAQLSLVDLAVEYRGDAVAGQPALGRLASFAAPARVTAVAAADLGGGGVLLLAAGADGGVCRLRLQVPTAPGSRPEQIQLRGEDFDGADLLPWAQPHAAAVAGLDVQPDARAALTASADGSLAVTHLDGDGGDCRTVWACGGAVTHTAAKWAGPAGAAVTASLQGRVQAWDTRAGGGGDAARGPLVAELAAAGGAPLTCLDVHPAQSYCVAAGDAAGRVHVWDMRRVPGGGGSSSGGGGSGGGEVAVVTTCGGGALSALAFDAGLAASAATGAARLVYGTSGGEVGLIQDAAGGAAPRRLYAEPAAGVAALALGAVGPSSQLFALTEQEGLVFIANAV